MKTFNLKVITPAKIIFEGEVSEVVLPTKEGNVGVLADHVSYIAPLKAGELKVKLAGGKAEEHDFAIDFGLAEFMENQLTVLAAGAVAESEIDLAAAEAAKKRAEEVMAQKVETEEYTEALAALEREVAKIKVANKYRLKRKTV